MNVSQFWVGFGVATAIGILSALLNRNWRSFDDLIKLLFLDIPWPILSDGKIGAVPKKSPLQLLLEGLVQILGRLLLLIAVFVLWCLPFWFVFEQEEFTVDFFTGIIFTGGLGLLLQNAAKTRKEIVNAINRIIRPPMPSLEFAELPNKHFVAARPTLPAFIIVMNSLGVIIFESAWLLFSSAALLLVEYWLISPYIGLPSII